MKPLAAVIALVAHVVLVAWLPGVLALALLVAEGVGLVYVITPWLERRAR